MIPRSFFPWWALWSASRFHAVMVMMIGLAFTDLHADAFSTPLPDGVRAVWEPGKAFHETTPTRERICLNGLWRWQPGDVHEERTPVGNWGFFKVPGCWPGIADYMQKDSQTLFANTEWKGFKPAETAAAWYEREITVPSAWSGRAFALQVESLNSLAIVFVDGAKVDELHFPGGELDLTHALRTGATHRLSILVVALPMKGVMLSYTDSASAREVKGAVARRGLCGDVFLVSRPRGPRITDLRVATSVRQRHLTVFIALDGLAPDGHYRIQTRLFKSDAQLEEFISPTFQAADLREGRLLMTNHWMPDTLWDIHTPQNTFDLKSSLVNADGTVLDSDWRQRIGFREFWIEGRDFVLNGTRIALSAVPLDNAQIGAALATYESACESLRRLKSFGINYVYTHHYGCEPGAHLDFSEILRAADDVGMLVGFTQPHFSHYEWSAADADEKNGYARHAAYYARVAGLHPSVVMYAMSHNATGYEEDMNPDLIDGIHGDRDQWAAKNVKLATRAEAIVRRMDPTRIVYHHASGNLGVMHDSNFYPNFAPIQELDDWFEHWATTGVKPAFTCEYGAPFTWDWTMYRGWYKGQREWGSARVPWEFCLAEWNAQFLGDPAYQISEPEKTNLRWEAGQYRAGNVWHRWDYPNSVGSDRFDERYPVFARYLTFNWRAYRTWGVSGISPWEFEHFWKVREGVDRRRKNLKVDWDHLQRPGFSPDFIDQQCERMDLAFEASDWIATPAAEALMRNNRPLLAYIAGKTGAFTAKDHNYRAGETAEKQFIAINNSREAVTCSLSASLNLPSAITAQHRVQIAVGDQVRIPFPFTIPANLPSGRYELHLTATFNNGESQDDRFQIDVVPNPGLRDGTTPLPRIALFDPKGETGHLLQALGISAESVTADTDLSPFEVLVIGKAGLTVEGAFPDLSRVRLGLRVIVFEQTSDVLEKRLGFRVQEYGLRDVFPRVAGHPALAGINPENLRDWRGSATLLASRLKYEMRSRYGPTVEWAGIPETRVWRCGNRGNVASVLIEKPARGNFLPILDGGFSLQYSPLLEYRGGDGSVVFCQLDVTGRTEADPTAEAIVRNLFRYVSEQKPAVHRVAVYAGEADGRKHLESLGIPVQPFEPGTLSATTTLVLGPGCGAILEPHLDAVRNFVRTSENLLAIGLDSDEINRVLPFKVTLRNAEHIAGYFEPFTEHSPFAGVGSADVHNRDPRTLPLVSSGAECFGDGVLAVAGGQNVVFVQIAPWHFEGAHQANLRRTFRRSSTLLNRVLANLGVADSTALLERFHHPVADLKTDKRWLDGLYVDQPEEWDDPYRFFRW